MPTSALTFRIFLSSPGDVPQERDDAQAVVNDINASREFEDMFVKIELYRWEGHVPPSARQSAQETVNKYSVLPSECDLVVVIFWTRLGTPTVVDNREYLSGTDYEYTQALESGKPEIFVYKCTQDDPISRTDPQRDEKNRQFDAVTQYINKLKYEQKRLIGEYATHDDFKVEFKRDLLIHLRHIRQKGNTPPPPPPAKPKIDVPYKGLKALRAEDVPIFFGRVSESLDVLARAENKRFVPILGASGSGKSSLVMAGVLPQLVERGWLVIQCTPDVDPFYQLASVIVELPEYRHQPSDKVLEARPLATRLRDNPPLLTEKLRDLYPNRRVALYIDQFEELFTLAEKANPTQVKPFIEAIRHPADTITTLITLRADFYETALSHVDDLKNETYGLKKPSAFALYEMITRPAQDAGYTLDDRLAETIITQLGDDSGALALMAYLMETLYRRAKGRDDTHITQDDYDELGGVKGAMNTLAEKAYAELPFADKESVLRNVFFHLIALTADESGQLVPTRRRTALADFLQHSPERVLIDQFADARLLVTDEQTVEVAHEAILRYWEQLAGWIDQNKGNIVLYRQFERDADVWAQNRDKMPLPQHESLKYFHQALDALGKKWDTLPEPLKSYTEPEANRLLRELDDIKTSHFRRMKIGERFVEIGDTRKGVLVRPDGIPDIAWCFVEKGGQIRIIGDGNNVTQKPSARWGLWRRQVDKKDDKEKDTFTIKPFYVAKYLTTHAQYQAFVDAPDGYNNPKWWKLFPEKYRLQALSSARNPNPNAPRDAISWYQSIAFVNWMDARYRSNGLFETELGLNPADWKISLPPEWYWQWMAQNGNEWRAYPWGRWDEYSRANTHEAGLNDKSISVGMYPRGVANCGAYDVAGNLWEWCLNDYDTISEVNRYSNGAAKVLRGGSFDSDRDDARAVARSNSNPNFDYYNGGCRVFVVPIVS